MGDTLSLKITDKVLYIQHFDRSRYDSTDLFRITDSKQLHLKYLDKEFSLNLESPAISLGRDTACDFIVNSNYASRLHARIEIKRGKFVLIDQSTNGTFIKASDGKKSYLRREALPLLGNGVISLGVNPDQEGFHLIHFSD